MRSTGRLKAILRRFIGAWKAKLPQGKDQGIGCIFRYLVGPKQEAGGIVRIIHRPGKRRNGKRFVNTERDRDKDMVRWLIE